LPRLFQPDYKDGTLQEWVLSPTSPRVWVSMKLLAYWLMMAVPLMVLTPIVGILFHLSSTAIEVLVISLVLGTPSLWLVGALLAALTVSVEGKPMLISLVVLPLLTPVLMLGTLSVQKASQGLGYRGELGLLGAVLALALTLLPTLIGYLLRVMVLE
ncbi:MAG TPA: heme exporter protein CcmB, partial [Coxiellaceae bacterium]|nr:heme exporter protein CcmB [Coxiellaceae bacterium]